MLLPSHLGSNVTPTKCDLDARDRLTKRTVWSSTVINHLTISWPHHKYTRTAHSRTFFHHSINCEHKAYILSSRTKIMTRSHKHTTGDKTSHGIETYNVPSSNKHSNPQFHTPLQSQERRWRKRQLVTPD